MLPKIVLVTGPPLNGRDEYIHQAIELLRKDGVKVGYHHVFDYMQKVSPKFGLTNLSRENVLDVSSSRLQQIRDEAFNDIKDAIKESSNDIELISTPANFRINPSSTSSTGRINGLEIRYIELFNLNMIVVLIANLLEVRKNLLGDEAWKARVDSNLKTLAEWRRESIELVEDFQSKILSKTKNLLDITIFAKGNDAKTFADLLLSKKPRIYLSYHITEATKETLENVQIIKRKMMQDFVCIDPYAIKDWDIVTAFDNAILNDSTKVVVGDTPLTVNEVEEAINEIRAQIVFRDYDLIEGTHATVVCHLSEFASYGVMSEIIHTRTEADNPVYVLYPFKKRPSPFFEFYVGEPSNIIHNGDIEALTDLLIEKMKNDIKRSKWTRWRI
jgi:adenylate kinase